jgi:hypothetical protein
LHFGLTWLILFYVSQIQSEDHIGEATFVRRCASLAWLWAGLVNDGKPLIKQNLTTPIKKPNG